MKRLTCLIGSLNITLIKTKTGIFLIDDTNTIPFAFKIFQFQYDGIILHYFINYLIALFCVPWML